MSTLALGWVFIAIFGLVVNLFAVADAKVDRYYAQHHLHKGTRLIVANANIRRERTRVFIQIAFCAAGLLSVYRPATEPLQGTRAWIGVAMMLASLLTVFNSFADRQDRKKLLDLIDEQEDHRRRNDDMRQQAQEFLDKHDKEKP